MGRIDEFLQDRKNASLLRTLKPASQRENGLIVIDNKSYIDFSSNDYLGLSNHPNLKKASKNAIDKYNTSTSGSRLLSGDLTLTHQLEERIALFKKKQAGLVFNSGYQANLGIISALCTRGDVVFADKLCHASIIDGILLSGAKLFRFLHNDIEQIECLLKKERSNYKNALVITESVFSMDGDKAPLEELVELKNKYTSQFMVDEAHATGIFGKNGTGLIEEYNLSKEVDLIMGTFSKALGSFGGYLACSSKIKEYLINTSRSFIYSTSLPPAIIAANLASLDLVEREPNRRIKLLENSTYLRKSLMDKGFKVKGSSQIIPLVVGDNKRAVTLSDRFQSIGFWVLPIRPPTVPKGESRLRFSLTYSHSKEVLDKLISNAS